MTGTDSYRDPPGFENWNPALRGAFNKGRKAAAAGEPKTACPYQDKRKDCGRLTWSRSLIAAWNDGWDWEYKSQVITQYYEDRLRIEQTQFGSERS